MISNELLSEVMGYKCYIMDTKHIHFLHNNRVNDIVYEQSGDLQYNINKYELAHKCKEWALSKGYSYLGNNKLCNIHSKDGTIIALTNNNISKWYDINIDFIACQWILDKGSK